MTATNTTTGEVASSAPSDIAVTVNPLAETPIAVTLTPSASTVGEGSSVTLAISAIEPDGDGTLSYTLSGIPSDATLSNANGALTPSGGSITLAANQLAGLTLKLGETTAALSLTATNTEGASTATSAAVSATVTATPVAENPALGEASQSVTVNNGSQGNALGLTLAAFDSDDVLTVTITGVPSDATLNAGTFDNSTQTWTISPTQLSALGGLGNLAINAGVTSSTLTITATNAEGGSAQETLAVRVIPVVVNPKYWASAISGNWALSSAWSLTDGGPAGAGAPTSSDNAIIDPTGSNYTVTINSSDTAQSLTISSANATVALNSGGTLALGGTLNLTAGLLNVAGGTITASGGAGAGAMTLASGTATFSGSTTIGTFTQSGGLFNGSGTLTVTGASAFSGGTQSGSGTTNAQGGAAFSSTGFALDGGHTLQLGGASTASGTNVQINLNGANPNTGLSDAGSGILTIGNGATFNDQTTSSGLIIFASNRSGDTGSTAAVNNAGTFTKSGSATTSTISTLFNNTNTVDVESGTLNLSGGGTDVGATYKGPGTVNFSGGTRTLDSNSSITAANATFSGGQTTVNGGTGTGLLTVTGGTATFNGAVTTGALAQSGGLFNGSGTLTVTGASAFSGGTRERFWDDQCAGRGGV